MILYYVHDEAILLLHFNNSLQDHSKYKYSVNKYGNYSLNSSTYKFGTGSLYCEGGVIIYPNIPLNDFTIECWCYAYYNRSDAVVQMNFSDGGIILLAQHNNDNYVYNGSWVEMHTGASYNKWNHQAMVRSGNKYYNYLNGNLVVSRSINGCRGNLTSIIIGQRSNYYGYPGFIDEVLLTNNCKYDHNFIPNDLEYKYIYADFNNLYEDEYYDLYGYKKE